MKKTPLGGLAATGVFVALFAAISLVRRLARSAAPGVKALASRVPTTVPVRHSQPVG